MHKKLLLWLSINISPTAAALQINDSALKRGFVKIESPEKFRTNSCKESTINFCKKINKLFKRYRWNEDLCSEINWQYDFTSKDKDPLLYIRFGTGKNTTLILGGVHPDEITPVHLVFKFAHYLQHNPQILHNKNNSVVIAPLVNPDGFFNKKLLRNNKTTDPNRNFLTRDWYKSSFVNYKNTRQNIRKFPGYIPASEPETLMQKELIEKFKPKKIISIHAPYCWYDYDGPDEQQNTPNNKKNNKKTKHKSNNFIHSLSSSSNNYKVVNFRIFPGSLGNYCGAERNIPTVTLELPSTLESKALEYWGQFKPALIKAINYNFVAKKSK
jgi:murein peptide amidase A